MTGLRDLVAHLLHQRADVTDQRARRQWRKVREADRVVRAYDDLERSGVLELRLDVRRK